MGTAVAAAIEIAQLGVYSRFTAAGEVVVESLGVAIGVALARWWHRGSQSPQQSPHLGRAVGQSLVWAALAALYAAFLGAVFCVPFELIRDPHQWAARLDGFLVVPFARLYAGSDFNTASEILRKIFFFAPLGALLAMSARPLPLPVAIRRALLVLLLLLAAALGTGIELAQVFLAPHIPDVTDVLLYTIGAGLGMMVTVRLGSARNMA
jgi:glycopeptide antibiotics resistance protein